MSQDEDLIGSEISALIDQASTVLDVVGLGKLAVGAFQRRRLEDIRSQLIEDARRGKISATNLYDEERVGGYIFRLTAAIRQGVRAKNIRLLARYFFGNGAGVFGSYDESAEDADIIESLSDAELRCLAIYQTAIQSGWLSLRSEGAAEDSTGNYSDIGIDLLDLFETHEGFRDASFGLIRSGLVRPVSAYGMLVLQPTPKLLAFLRRLDLEHMVL